MVRTAGIAQMVRQSDLCLGLSPTSGGIHFNITCIMHHCIPTFVDRVESVGCKLGQHG